MYKNDCMEKKKKKEKRRALFCYSRQWKQLHDKASFLEKIPALLVLLAGNNGAFLTNFSFANC